MTTEPANPQPAGNADPNAAITTLTLNYWLSVFFTWIPALIFFFVERGKNATVDAHNRANLNFQLVRTLVGIATGLIPTILGLIPYLGGLLGGLIGFVLWAASIVLFVFAIIAAVKGPEEARAAREYKYPFNIDFVK